MLGYFARRLAFWLPTAVVLALLAVAAVARGGPADAPIFVRLDPSDAKARAVGLASRAALDGDDADAASRELAEMGAAALPFVVPMLDALAPSARARVALALAPVARRMALEPGDFDDPSRAASAWTRYWLERGPDFRPAVVARTLRRFAERPTEARLRQVRELDTAALAAIADALDATAEPNERFELLALASRVVPSTRFVGEARDAGAVAEGARRFRAFWLTSRSKWVVLEGVPRVAATLLDTRLARAVVHVVLADPSSPPGERGKIARFVARAGRSALVVALVAALALPLGVALGLASIFVRSRRVAVVVAAPALCFAAAGAALALDRRGPGLVLALAPLLVAPIAWHAHAVGADLVGGELERAALARGASRLRFARDVALGSLPGPLAIALAGEWPLVAGAALVVELGLGVDGLGRATLDAIASHDLEWTLLVTFASLVAGLAVATIGDLAARARDPRQALGRRRLGGASS